MRRIFRQCPITFPHSTVTDRRRHRAPLDNYFCLTNINSPSSKFNAKLQLAVHERGITILIPGESSRAVHHRPASSRRLSRRRSAGHTETHNRHSWNPIDNVLLFSYCTDGFHLDIQKDSKTKSITAMEYYSWRLMQSDGRAWTSCCAATGCPSGTYCCRHLCKNGTAAAKVFAVHQNSLRMLTLFWRMTDVPRSTSAQFYTRSL